MNDRKTRRIPFIAAPVWRQLFSFQQSFVFQMARKAVRARGSTVPRSYRGRKVWIYTGKRWRSRIISWWMVGFKFGEFTWNRKRAVYKSKRNKKKSKK